MLNAINEIMRESYLKDCEIGLRRWNRAIERAGHPGLALKLPSPRFRRSIGAWVGQPVDPQGNLISNEVFLRELNSWIPSEKDRAFVTSLMQKVIEPGKVAGWVAPPERGINNMPADYEYVRLH
jgi:benzoyl-CoA 2,3-dioxygenase component B